MLLGRSREICLNRRYWLDQFRDCFNDLVCKDTFQDRQKGDTMTKD